MSYVTVEADIDLLDYIEDISTEVLQEELASRIGSVNSYNENDLWWRITVNQEGIFDILDDMLKHESGYSPEVLRKALTKE